MARYLTQIDYAQGLFIHLMNKAWFELLPADLQAILLEVIAEESAASRALTRRQQQEQIAAAEAKGVEFFPLSEADRQHLIELSAPVYKAWGEKIGVDYLHKVQQRLGN